LVLGPDAVPLVTAVEQAAAAPELTVLSALAHGSGARAVQVALAALGAIQGLDDERARLYLDLVMASLVEAARRALEAVMADGTYEYQSDFARRYVAKGRAEGEARGKAEGEAKGRAEGRADAVVAVLEARGLDVPAALRQRLGGCTDLAQLDEWLRRAVTIASAAELLD
ncbi:MAG: hypothetical protein HY744_33490, partial [Deltaproteobacteria bacterium]|nr:hypothetical protein [Deltaproteobacteria bacterium]